MGLKPLDTACYTYAGFSIVPDFLDNESFGLSNDAKLLYSYILRKITLACKSNSYLDEAAIPYCYFSIDEIMKRIHCQKAKACEIIRSLENAKLIRREAEGKKRKIYLYVEDSFLVPTESIEDDCLEQENSIGSVPALCDASSEGKDETLSADCMVLKNEPIMVRKSKLTQVRKSNLNYTRNNIHTCYTSSKKCDDEEITASQSLFENPNKDFTPCIDRASLSPFASKIIHYIDYFAQSNITGLRINGCLVSKNEILESFKTMTNQNLDELESNCSAITGIRVTNALRYYLAALYNLLTTKIILPSSKKVGNNYFNDFRQRNYKDEDLEAFFIKEVQVLAAT